MLGFRTLNPVVREIDVPIGAARELRPNRWHFIFLLLAISMLCYFTVLEVSRVFISTQRGDFHHFYTAAQALMSGADLYQSGTGGYIYPPFFAFLLAPLVALPPVSAQLIWLGVNLMLIALILLLGLRILASGFQLTLKRSQALGVCALAVLLSYNQIRAELLMGQCDALVLAGLTLALYWLDRRPILAGVILGAAASIKYQAIVFLPLLLLRCRWRVMTGLVMGVTASAFLPALVIGWNRNLEYLAIAFRGLIHIVNSTHAPLSHVAHIPSITWHRNISISGGLTRVFLDHGLQKSDALIPILVVASVVCFLLWRLFRHYGIPFFWRTRDALGNPKKEIAMINLEWWGVLMVMLIFSPLCTDRHLLLMLNMNLLAAMMLMLPRPHMKRWPLIVATMIAQLGMAFSWQLPGVYWKHIGGPCWILLPFLLLVVWSALKYTCVSPVKLRNDGL